MHTSRYILIPSCLFIYGIISIFFHPGFIYAAPVSSSFGTTGSNPVALAIDASDNIYVLNQGDSTLTKITPDGTSTPFGTTGSIPAGIVIDKTDNLYITNSGDNTVTKITPDGVSRLLGATGVNPISITIDSSGNIYTTNRTNSIAMITQGGVSTIFGTTSSEPFGIVVDSSNSIYTAIPWNQTVTKITPDGVSNGTYDGIYDIVPPTISLIGSGVIYLSTASGYYVDNGAIWNDNRDGSGSSLTGTLGVEGSFTVTVTGVSPIDLSSPGTHTIEYSKVDMNGNTASITRTVHVLNGLLGLTTRNSIGIVFDTNGNIYTANRDDNTITKVTPSGVSSVFATTGQKPIGITIDLYGNIYTANRDDNTITKVTPSGVSSTFGTVLYQPSFIGTDSFGNIYVTSANKYITKFTPEGISSAYGNTIAASNNPSDMLVDDSGAVYIADIADSIEKILPDGTINIIGPQSFRAMTLVFGDDGTIYASSFNGITIKINPDGTYSTIANNPLSQTSLGITDTVVDDLGNVYTVNSYDNGIIQISPDGTSRNIGNIRNNIIPVDYYHMYMIIHNGYIYVINTDDGTIFRFNIATNTGTTNTGTTNTGTTNTGTTNTGTTNTGTTNTAVISIGAGGGSAGSSLIASSTYLVNSVETPAMNYIQNRNQSGSFISYTISPNQLLSFSGQYLGYFPIYTLKNTKTEYICKSVIKVFNEDKIISQDITRDKNHIPIKTLLLFRTFQETNTSIKDSLGDSMGDGVLLNQSFISPGKYTTRAEFIKILTRSLLCHYKIEETKSKFLDVHSNSWYNEYIVYAEKNGWINGFQNGYFYPDRFITRGEVAKILANAIKLQLNSAELPVSNDSEFSKYIAGLKDIGVLNSSDFLYPDNFISRSDLAAIVYKIFFQGE